MQQPNVKCPACGLNNFASIPNCRRCSASLNGAPSWSRVQSQQEVNYEHTAPDGTGHIGILKLIGVLCLLGSILASVLIVIAAVTETRGAGQNPVASIILAAVIFLEGITVCAVLFVIAIMAENLVAIRKNTAHLAGIRSNMWARTPMAWSVADTQPPGA